MTGPILVQNIIVNDKIIIIKSFFFLYRSVIMKNIIAEQNSGYNLSVWYCTYRSLIVRLF